MTDTFKTDCLAIMALAMDTPENKAEIMCGWVGHCNFFEVRVYLGGWKLSASPDLVAECRIKASEQHSPYHTAPSVVLEQIKALLA